MAAKKKATAKGVAERDKAVIAKKDTLDRVEADAPSPSTRASNRLPGTEIPGGSGPQERGAPRGARRPYTETLPGARRPGEAPIPVLSAEEERIAQRRKEIEAERKKAAEAPKEQRLVVATRMGVYGVGAATKRYPAGSQFMISLAKGEELPSWVEDAEEYEERIQKAQQAVVGAPATRAGRRERAMAKVAEEDARLDLKKDEDEVL